MQNKNSNFILRLLFATIFISLLNSCTEAQDRPETILPGASQPEEYLKKLDNKNVGLVVNQTSLVYDSIHLVDFLLQSDIRIKKIFAPEHGFRGEAADGEVIEDSRDRKTGIPIVSLYGVSRKLPDDEVADLDMVIFDIQDVGARFYTYISTMHYVMETCARKEKKLLILDRPNPNGFYVDGPVMEDEFKSFVGMHAIPVVHGLTIGELALMINGEGWLENGLKCELEIVKVKKYDHTSRYVLPVRPSPNLPNDRSVNLYPSLCFFEGTKISLGRGTEYPFQVLGYPDSTFGDFRFKPVPIPGVSNHPPLENKWCFGVDLREGPELEKITLSYLIDFYNSWHFEESFFNDYFDRLAGTANLREQIKNGLSEEEIRQTWSDDLEVYLKKRKKYLLYKDFE